MLRDIHLSQTNIQNAMNGIVRLFSCCIPVKGYRRSFIYDLQRPKSSNAIPNDLYDILVSFPKKSVEEIKGYYHHQFDETIDSYFEFLLEREFAYVFEKEELVHFPAIENVWDSPSEVTNSILCVTKSGLPTLRPVLVQLSDLRCDAVQFLIYDAVSIGDLMLLASQFDGLRIFSVELLLNHSELFDYAALPSFLDENPRIRRVVIGGCTDEFVVSDNRISLSSGRLDFQNGCGKIAPQYFSIGMGTFFEGQHHNTCLNRKVCLDTEGNIMNCPFMGICYGNIRDVTLKDAISMKGFTDLWDISKDEIDVCKDCEFRYMCTDCRCFVKHSENVFSQPSKCTYNPYVALWEGEKGYVPIEACGYYDENLRFVPDVDKIIMWNEKIVKNK